MNIIKKVEGGLEKFAIEIGAFEAKIIGAHSATVLQILKNIDAAAKNPVVEGVLSAVITPTIMVHYPQAVAVLDKAINTITEGTQIAADVNAASGTEAKLIIFIKDVQNTNVVLGNLLLRGLCEQILSVLDNKALTAEVYQYYLAAEQLLNEA